MSVCPRPPRRRLRLAVPERCVPVCETRAFAGTASGSPGAARSVVGQHHGLLSQFSSSHSVLPDVPGCSALSPQVYQRSVCGGWGLVSPGGSGDSGKRLCASRHELSPLRAASSGLGAIAKGGASSPSEMKAPLRGSGRQQGGMPPPGTGAWFKAVAWQPSSASGAHMARERPGRASALRELSWALALAQPPPAPGPAQPGLPDLLPVQPTP